MMIDGTVQKKSNIVEDPEHQKEEIEEKGRRGDNCDRERESNR